MSELNGDIFDMFWGRNCSNLAIRSFALGRFRDQRSPHENICSNLNQRVTGTSLKDDSVSTHRLSLHVAYQSLELPGFVFNEFLRLWNTQNFLPHNRWQFRGRWEKKCKNEILKTRSKTGRFLKIGRNYVNWGKRQYSRHSKTPVIKRIVFL